eukprot:8522689-Pyramimonas_sp.AAC.1
MIPLVWSAMARGLASAWPGAAASHLLMTCVARRPDARILPAGSARAGRAPRRVQARGSWRVWFWNCMATCTAASLQSWILAAVEV